MLPYAFVDPKGKVGVKIYIANETIPTGTNLDLKIAFTAYFGSCLMFRFILYVTDIVNITLLLIFSVSI